MDSQTSSFTYVPVDQFTPNSRNTWTSFGNVATCTATPDAKTYTLTGVAPGDGLQAPIVKIFILGPTSFRVRFNPRAAYEFDGSFAVVNSDLGATAPQIIQNDAVRLSVNLGGIRLDVNFTPFTVEVFRGGQLISSDADQGLVYLPGNMPGHEAVANFKSCPANARYFGFGEKGGPMLDMRGTSMTFFNFDNYKYSGPSQNYVEFSGTTYNNRVIPTDPLPDGTLGGPLDWREPLYNSIPLLIEDNPNPLNGDGTPGVRYAYGLFLDNESQSYFNVESSSTSSGNMSGKYYFGALYGEIDYYFMAGDTVADVLKQYVTLTGPPALAPMWALGYHQGCYGYYDHYKVMNAVMAYRNARIPLDGIHIDVDFQDNYRTFTASPKKFPNGGADTFAALAAEGVKASTNITGIVTTQPLDEAGVATPYATLQSGLAQGVFIQDVRMDEPNPPVAPQPFITNESYGCNEGSNPYPSPGAPYGPGCTDHGHTALGTYGYYADLGQLPNRTWWGQQYAALLNAGLEMVWQDMTDPATQGSVSDSMPWKTLPLNVRMWDYTANAWTAHARIQNVFALNLISATYEGIQTLRAAAGVNKRPFIIARGGYAGVQRYAATWTGDSASDWHFMRILIPEILNFGLSGQPMAGADVGGFATSGADGTANGTVGGTSVFNGQVQGAITDPDLLTRWTTASAFFGWFRNHYDGYSKQYQEPYAYPEPVPTNCRKYINIRYKLLQMFYDCLYEAHTTGMPICRAMFLTDGDDPEVYQHLDDQFMVGHDLLVAPVVTPQTQYRDVYLPAGSSWYAYMDNVAPLGAATPGGQSISWFAPVDIVPLYVRAGAIIPRRELEQYVGQLAENPLTFDIYPGPASTYQLYLDDKIGTTEGANPAYRVTLISQQQAAVPGGGFATTVQVAQQHSTFRPVEAFFYVAFLGTGAPISVTVDGAQLPLVQAATDEASADQLAQSHVNAAYYNKSLATTFVKVLDIAPNHIVVCHASS